MQQVVAAACLAPGPDQWIVDVAERQSRSAFASLFQLFGPKLKTYLLRRGVADGAAEDLVQEVMLLVWTKARQFDPTRASASAWIYSIARNRHVDLFRREQCSKNPMFDEPEPESTPEDHLRAYQSRQRLRGALGALSLDQVQLVRMSFFDDRSHAEIAHRLSLPLGTVKSRLRRAAAQLRLALVESY